MARRDRQRPPINHGARVVTTLCLQSLGATAHLRTSVLVYHYPLKIVDIGAVVAVVAISSRSALEVQIKLWLLWSMCQKTCQKAATEKINFVAPTTAPIRPKVT